MWKAFKATIGVLLAVAIFVFIVAFVLTAIDIKLEEREMQRTQYRQP